MSNQNRNSRKINYSRLPVKARKKLQKKDKRIFPIKLPSKVMETKKEETICYRCNRNKSSKICKECRKPICKVCETKNPKGYCLPCRNEHFVMLEFSLE